MERLNKALQLARQSSKLHNLLGQFFNDQVVDTMEVIKVCKAEELTEHRAYLVALTKLEQELLGYTDKYKLIEARRQHVSTRAS